MPEEAKTVNELRVEVESLRARCAELERLEQVHRKTEEALKMQAQVLENMAEGVKVVDEHGIISYTNRANDAMFGYERGELIGRHVTLLNAYPPEQNARVVREIMDRLKEQGMWGGEFSNRRKDGTLFATSARITAVELSGHTYWVSVAEDTTERKRLEQQLRQAQKMEAVGRLAGGVAHDFNNLLTVILGYGEILLARLPSEDPLRALIEEIHKAGERAASLTRQLLAFSRQQVIVPQVLDLNRVVSGVQKLLRRLIGEDVQLTLVPEPSLDRVKADPGLIEQVIMNLAVNARDAMPQGGKLTIETGNAVWDEEYSRLHPEARAGRYVMLAVTDTGVGMDEETRARLFEPFFTTKEQGKGTGLGLATVYGIVKQSEGFIYVYSEPGHGTCFKVYLPSVEAPDVAEPAPSKARPSPRGDETLLLVEDEDAVRAISRHVLQMSGYHVLEAGSAAEAVRIGEAHPGPIHLLVTDVVMPQTSGRQLAEHLTRQRPETKVLYLSGYTNDSVIRHGVLEAESAFLQKPFTPDALARKVRAVLDQP